jgi:hypothetical protein
MTLAPPFVWADGLGFPGGSGTVEINGYTYPFCTNSLPAPPDGGINPTTCLLAVSYTGEASGNGQLTLDLTNAYESNVAIALQGTASPRALLTVSEDTGFFGCTDATCGPAEGTGGQPLNLLVSNRGGEPTTALGVGASLASGWSWGPGGDAGSFPGGTGLGSMADQSYEYCTAQTLGAGQQCMITIAVPCNESGTEVGAVNLAYADATGSVSPNANRNIAVPACSFPESF